MWCAGTQNILQAARQAGVKRVVYISTEALLCHGANPIVNADETTPVPENTGFYAPYSRSKAIAEKAVLVSCRCLPNARRPASAVGVCLPVQYICLRASQAANDPGNGFSTVSVRPRFVWGKGILCPLATWHVERILCVRIASESGLHLQTAEAALL